MCSQINPSTSSDMAYQTGSYWHLTITSPENLIALETAIDGLCAPDAVSLEAEDAVHKKFQAWFQAQPDETGLKQIMHRALSQPEKAEFELKYVADHDWLTENRNSFPPLQIGRFWVYGRHIEQPRPKALIPVLIDAAQAFGSGTHPTTEGCLLALSQSAKLPARPRQILDMGCGSAILAIAASHLFPGAAVMAADNDPISVRTAAENRRLNHVSPHQMKTVLSAGFSNRMVARSGPYDLIFANILAGPLRLMAADLCMNLHPQGRLILSGLLQSQVNFVMQAYAIRGMRLINRIDIGEWSCLVLRPRSTKRVGR